VKTIAEHVQDLADNLTEIEAEIKAHEKTLTDLHAQARQVRAAMSALRGNDEKRPVGGAGRSTGQKTLAIRDYVTANPGALASDISAALGFPAQSTRVTLSRLRDRGELESHAPLPHAPLRWYPAGQPPSPDA
jgi:hypothetical protein